jgi:phosphatidylinositol-3-phosphatase
LNTHHASALVALSFLAAITACGGAGPGSSSSSPGSSTITSVAVACTPATLASSATSQCTATVQGTGSYSSAVTWSASAGSINGNGLFTAPGSAANVTVTATSTQDSTKSGTTKITVQSAASTITSVAVSCAPATVAPNGTSQCTATVQGTGSYSSAVTWSASAGSISSTGLFTAPASAGTVTATATSTQDASKSGSASIAIQFQVPASKHVVMVMEENQSYSTIVGNTSDWPALNSLITSGALPTNYYADTHPSIGNYFMLTTGQLLTNDDNSTTVWNVDNIARRMLSDGITFRVYAEGIAQGYLGGNTGLYLIRHNPFAMLSDVADSAQVANAVIWPFTQFAADLADGTLPEFSFIVPNIDDDAHTGTPHQADTWLQTNVVSPLSNNSAFQPGGDGVLIVDFDEAATSDTSHGGGHVAPVFWGPAVQSGYQQASATVYQHESMLRTVMEMLGLPNPPGAAAKAPDMSEFFVQK